MIRRSIAYGVAVTLLCALGSFGAVAAAPNGADDQDADNSPVAFPGEGMRPPRGYARPPFHTKPDANVSTPTGLSPNSVRHAYGFDQIANGGAGQIIAIIDAYDDPNIESDLATFSKTFGLPACTSATGCFGKIYAGGAKPQTNAGWSLEMALDVEWAHAIAPNARILLVEASSNSLANLMAAVDVAVGAGASVVSMSFGGIEFSTETSADKHFNAENVAFLASSGDSGNGVEYPAASPLVTAVGGTTLAVDGSGNYLGETAWSGSGGGVSQYEYQPTGQTAWPVPVAGKRGVPDAAYNADPNTGFPVYSSVRYQGRLGWFQVGGTSAGAPQWAGMMAIVNSLRAAAGKGPLVSTYNALYSLGHTNYSADYNDIVAGANGTCGSQCNATVDYDYVTGLGSPKANNIIPALVNLP